LSENLVGPGIEPGTSGSVMKATKNSLYTFYESAYIFNIMVRLCFKFCKFDLKY
jgi:hypothetical protein